MRAWGLSEDVEGLKRFADACVDAFSGRVALVKPQVAFFETYGSGGIVVLEDTIAALRAAGTLVLADAKRGDIGSTMAAYARAWLGDGPLGSDALTVSPYLGFGSLAPALELASENGRGVFVLAATSNPEGRGAATDNADDGRSVAQTMVDDAAAHNAGAEFGLGRRGGRSDPQPRRPDLSRLNGPILMPGVGAQGGGAESIRAAGARAEPGRGAAERLAASCSARGRRSRRLRTRMTQLADEFAFLQA